MGVPYGQMQHLPQRFKTLRLILPEGFLKGANMAQADSKVLRLGVDVGSTTVKTVVLDPNTNGVLFTRYQRHNAHQAATVRQLLTEAAGRFPDVRFRIGVCGSGGRPIAAALGAHYVQEVVANAAAIRALYPQVRTAVELGGQDAKVIFFHYDENAGRLQISDMRMNGSCAGGTGAFIDEIAALLNVPADEFEHLAAQGKTVYSISGRCGVFAKTDIQPLLIQGAERTDIALSTFQAIAKQTIGGLSQGLELTAPIIFEGGPLTFNPTLVRVFAERLGLEEADIVRPEHPETIVARGTAIAVDELFPGQQDAVMLSQALERLDHAPAQPEDAAGTGKPYFADDKERDAFLHRHQAELKQPVDATDRKVLRGYLGIDSGSTTSKFVFMDEDEQVTDTFYANNQGEPLRVVRQGLMALAEKYRKLGIRLEVLGLGTTGYGEQMLSAAFHADYHTDPLINHDLARMFTRRGIPVLTVDSLPGLDRADLHQSRVEITNDFHARMLSGAMVTAAYPSLEYVQIVSFGCGHDAILSDEIVRLLGEGSGKPPLILKVDESEAAGSLGIRVQALPVGGPEQIRVGKKYTHNDICFPCQMVTGELLVNFHPGTNFHVVEYLEKNGMETILPRITYQFRKDFQAANSEIRDFGAHLAPYSFALDAAVEGIQHYLERIAAAHPLYHKAPRPQDLYEGVSSIIPKTLTCGEGWLMAGEIAHYAAEGARSFIILQPFGCLPNHVCGRGVTKRLKELYPGVQILPLDLDPDTSYANVENRLQMLIMNQTAEQETMEPAEAPERRTHRGNYRRPTLSST